VSLQPEALQAKLVHAGRGGWCFEQNLLLSHVLTALGYRVTRLAARVRWNVPVGMTTSRSHMLLQVSLPEGEHIADVGFGGLTLTAPLKLVAGMEQPTPHEPHRLVAAGSGYALEARVAGEWQALYVFELHEQQLADYEVSNWYLCNHPDSQFVKGIVAARAASDRRYALRNTRFAIHHRGGETEKRTLTTVADYLDVLRGPLGIELPKHPRLEERIDSMLATPSP
jgi:N-hydroxyarylamine O-acetyltransferase